MCNMEMAFRQAYTHEVMHANIHTYTYIFIDAYIYI